MNLLNKNKIKNKNKLLKNKFNRINNNLVIINKIIPS